MAFLTKALSVQMLTINRYGRKQKNEHFWMISGVKGFLVRMTTAVDLKIGCALRIPPKYYVNMFFFFTWKMNKCHCLFLNSARHSLPFRRFPLQRQPNNDSSTQFGQQSLSFEHLSEVDVLHSQIHLTYVILVT